MTGVSTICQEEPTTTQYPAAEVSVPTSADQNAGGEAMRELTTSFSDAEIKMFVAALARRPAGREAILNCAPVVRALTASKRQGQRSVKERREAELTQR